MKANGSLPTTIGPYRITGHLGRGGMGEVLRGFDDRLDRPVAAKRILRDARDPENALRRFRREARSVARLNHPSIVQIYDWTKSAGEQWLIMELVEGHRLDHVIGRGRLSAEDALAIARDVASGLAAAHDAGIVHRDLKSSNVMLTHGGQAKVLDFGLAKPLPPKERGAHGRAAVDAGASTTAEGRVLGTPNAMSPEQALGHGADHRSDLFSLGVLLYEMLSGSPPFAGRNTPEILNRLCNVPETPLGDLGVDVPPEVSELVRQLLEKDPDLRPQSAHEVVAEIDRLGALPTDPPGGGDAAEPRDAADTLTEVDAATTRFEIEPMAAAPVPGAAEAAAEADRDSPRRAVARSPATVSALGLAPFVTLGLALFVALAVTLALARPSLRSGPIGGDVETLEAPDGATRGGLKKAELTRRGLRALDPSGGIADIDSAMHDFRQALEIDPRFAPALAGLAKAHRLDYVWRGRDPERLERALELALRAVATDEHLAVAEVELGWVYLDLGRHEPALEAFERALELEPRNAGAHAGLGQVYETQGDYARAEESVRRAIEAQPEIARLHSALGRIYYLTGRYDDAVRAFQRHLDEDPDAFVALSNLGATFYMQGRLDEAASQFQQALQIQPDAALYSNVGTIFFTEGQFSRAAEAFEKAIEHGLEQDPLAWGNLGDAYRWTPGRERDARDAYERAIALLAEGDPAETLTAHTRRVLFSAKGGDCATALAEADALVESNALDGPDATHGSAWYRLAVTREICGRRAEALRALSAALDARFSPDEVRRDPELAELRRDPRYARLENDRDGHRASPRENE